MLKNYYLGCPVWGYKDWVGKLFSANARPADYLHQYSRIFNSVEGNNTFYGIPKAETVKNWRRAIPESFRFCFKFPRIISHDAMLQDTAQTVTDFFRTMEPAADCMGLYFLQLPPAFGPQALPLLAAFLDQLPGDFRYAVEVRHLGFFDSREGEKRLNDLLAGKGVDRALFDTQTLHQLETNAPDLLGAQRKKPKMPSRLTVTGDRPMLRFVGHNALPPNLERLKILAAAVAAWIEAGKTPFVFLHSPDEAYAPALCRAFHEMVRRNLPEVDFGELPDRYSEADAGGGEQLSLF